MVLNSQRENIDPLLSRIADIFLNVNPNTLTWLSLLFAFLAGLFFFFSSPIEELSNFFLLISALFVFLNGLFDAIDGKVAKIKKNTSKRGDFLDHALDRFADVFIIGGLALSSWTQYCFIGFLAIVGVLLTSYMGTQSQAVGCKRNYSGFLVRADRLVLLMIAPVFQHILFYFDLAIIYGLYLLEWVLIYFAIVGSITAVQRFYSTLKYLDN